MADSDYLVDSTTLGQAVLRGMPHSFTSCKTLIDRTLAQLAPADWLACPNPTGNSIAVVLQHLLGNRYFCFTDFWITDGEKPNRLRDQEFEQPATLDVAALIAHWEAAGQVLFELLASLTPADLLRSVTVRGEARTALAALQRQVSHYAYPAGPVQLGPHQRGAAWRRLSIPRGQSELFNQRLPGTARPPL